MLLRGFDTIAERSRGFPKSQGSEKRAGGIIVSSTRWLCLILGPVLIVGVLYRMTMWGHPGSLVASESPTSPSRFGEPGLGVNQAELRAACQRAAEDLLPLLNARCNILVREPYVLAGDLSEESLERIYRDTILPMSLALSTGYFDIKPHDPIIILMFSGDRMYHRHAKGFDGRENANYHGYYQRTDRRIVLNISTGNGTLAHELTHALAHCDFPNMPEWFDEGLASLHEQSQFTDDGLRLEGNSNWRINFLLPAVRGNRLHSLSELMSTRTVRTEEEAVHYAHARYFCLYLQSRNLLEPFYRKFRHTAELDPTGIQALSEVLQLDSMETIERDFRSWLLNQASAGR
jgi:hypothetical protein